MDPIDNPTTTAAANARPVSPITAEEAERFERALIYLREHFRTAELKDIAEHVGYSPFHFHRRFALWAGTTPKALRTEMQIEHAKTLLLRGDVPLPTIAHQCGFAHQSHLTHRFKLSCTGDTPGRWLKRQRAAGVTPPPTAAAPIPLDPELALARAAA